MGKAVIQFLCGHFGAKLVGQPGQTSGSPLQQRRSPDHLYEVSALSLRRLGQTTRSFNVYHLQVFHLEIYISLEQQQQNHGMKDKIQ